MTVELVDNDARLQALLSEWSQLSEVSSWPNVFYEPWYLLVAQSAFDQKITHGFVWSNADQKLLIGYIPLSTQVRLGRGRPHTVENWHHDYCFSGQPLIREGYEHAFWSDLLATIDETPALGSILRLRSLKQDGASYSALQSIVKEQQRWHRVYRQFRRAILHHSVDADVYLQTHLTKKKRKEYRRQRRRLEDEGEVTAETLTELDNLDSWIDQFLSLEQAGWKGDEETAMGSAEPSRDFFRRVCKAAFAESKLDVTKLSLDGEPIAMLITFLSKPVGNFTFKIAFDEKLAKFSPGVLLELDYLERVMSIGNDIAGWSDSCAAEDHPMINKLWRDRLGLCSIKISPRRPIARLASIYDDTVARLFTRFNN